ncbi:ABC transporter substrate-binding protein [Neisseria gonorrhoeae]|nr:ABC transporter substrate-binding protein [Neisseria gonorrhoeae]
MPQDTRRHPAALPTAKPLARALPLNGGITRRMGETCKRFGKNRKGGAAAFVRLLQAQAYGFLCAALP